MMQDFNLSTIVPENFALVDGQYFLIVTPVDSDGYFFASDSDGEDREFYVDQVDLVMEVR